MRRLFISFLLLSTSFFFAFSQETPGTYYYPLGMEVINTHYLYGTIIGQRYIEYDVVNFNLITDHRFMAARYANVSSYQQIDNVKATENALIVNRGKTTGMAEDFFDDFILFKVPKSSETLTWKNEGRSRRGQHYSYNYEAKKVTISSNGLQVPAIRVIQWQLSGDGISGTATFWCKGLGDALSVNSEGDIVFINETVFDADIKNNKVVKDAITRISQLDALEKQPKELKDGKLDFKPAVIPSDLKVFAEKFRTAIINHEELAPYLGGELLEYYNTDIEFYDYASEAFSQYMKDPYFSGLEVLASELMNFNQVDGNDGFYTFPGFYYVLDDYFDDWDRSYRVSVTINDEEYTIGMIYKDTNIYKERSANSKIEYIANPYKAILLRNPRTEEGTTWYDTYSVKKEFLGYVQDNDIYTLKHYTFLIEKIEGSYKLVDVLVCSANDSSFESERQIREQEKQDFYKNHQQDSYNILYDFLEAHEVIQNEINIQMPKVLRSISEKGNGFTENIYNFNIKLSVYQRDSITVKNSGNMVFPVDILRNTINKCFDDGLMEKKTVVFEKYDYEVLIPGDFSYSNTFNVRPIHIILNLKNGEWTPDKQNSDLFITHKEVCQYLIGKELAQNPKLKKVEINILFFDSSLLQCYFEIADTIKGKKVPDRYLLGNQIEYK